MFNLQIHLAAHGAVFIGGTPTGRALVTFFYAKVYVHGIHLYYKMCIFHVNFLSNQSTLLCINILTMAVGPLIFASSGVI